MGKCWSDYKVLDVAVVLTRMLLLKLGVCARARVRVRLDVCTLVSLMCLDHSHSASHECVSRKRSSSYR